MLDSNVLISALIAHTGAAGYIYQEWRRGRFQLVTSEIQLAEIRRVSRYPRVAKRISRQVIGEAINFLQNAVYYERIPRKYQCEDPEDAYLLDLADISGADFLVTGDLRAGLLEKRKVGRASILSTSTFAGLLSA